MLEIVPRLRLSLFLFLILVSFCCSVWLLSISRLLVHSSVSFNLLLFLSSVVFISVAVFFSSAWLLDFLFTLSSSKSAELLVELFVRYAVYLVPSLEVYSSASLFCFTFCICFCELGGMATSPLEGLVLFRTVPYRLWMPVGLGWLEL